MSTRGKINRSASSDRTIRSLISLTSNASSSRTLNLIATWVRNAEDPGYQQAPFFNNSTLNRCIIVKHRLRSDELELFNDGRASSTKIILPIDPTNLSAGGQSFFVGQVGYREIVAKLFNGSVEALQHDEGVLAALDSLPSLDPFLLRERLRQGGFTPDQCYFEISDADAARMFKFARDEIAPLISMAFGDTGELHAEKLSKLASRILENDGGEELEPLRAGLGMSKSEFTEGAFCWKGFIYYKWLLMDLLPKINPLATEISKVRIVGVAGQDDRAYIRSAGAHICKAMFQSCAAVKAALKVYDEAYAGMTRDKEPKLFREFLLKAPDMFQELGEHLGSVQHVMSFWRFRFPSGAPLRAGAEELVDLFTDFEANFTAPAAD